MRLGATAVADRDVSDLSKEAALLISIHGDGADVFAAQKADSLFCAGDTANGERWSAIFRLIAESHRAGRIRRF
jgi:hypothetical protein